MIHYKMNQPGKSLGVIGLGGLGQMAVKFGKAFGLNVTVFSTSICKKEEALNVLGADKFIVSTDEEEMKVEHPVKNLSDHLILRFPTSNPMFHY
jgi:cinnamyl-alcohol dehydrogenase